MLIGSGISGDVGSTGGAAIIFTGEQKSVACNVQRREPSIYLICFSNKNVFATHPSMMRFGGWGRGTMRDVHWCLSVS